MLKMENFGKEKKKKERYLNKMEIYVQNRKFLNNEIMKIQEID